MQKISVVIVYWHSPDLQECLQHLSQSRNVELEVIVVDNGTHFDPKGLGEVLPLHWLHNQRNDGFARAANFGAENATADFILFLNPDVFVEEDTLIHLVTHLINNATAGCVAPKIRDEKGQPIWAAARSFRNLGQMIRELIPFKVSEQGTQPGPAQSLQGSCLMIRSELFRKLQGFDDRVALFSDDADLCLRAQKKGFQNWLVDAVATHRGGTSIQNMPNPAMTSLLRHQADDLYLLKHKGWFQVLLHHIILVIWAAFLLPCSIALLPFHPKRVWPYVKKHVAMLSYGLFFKFKTKDLPTHWQKSFFTICRKK